MQQKKILICDDDEGILDMMTMMFKAFGYDVTAEKNSLHVMSLLAKNRPDLLVLDLWMPVLSGDQILRTIRSSPEFSSLHVLVISASRDGQQIAAAAGADSYIQKPFDMAHLAATTKELM